MQSAFILQLYSLTECQQLSQLIFQMIIKTNCTEKPQGNTIFLVADTHSFTPLYSGTQQCLMSPLIIYIFPLEMRLLSGTCHSKSAKMEQTHELFLHDDVYELMARSLIEVLLCISYTTDLTERPHLPPPFKHCFMEHLCYLQRFLNGPHLQMWICSAFAQNRARCETPPASQIYKCNHSLLRFSKGIQAEGVQMKSSGWF